jgi:hypothetical protein
VRGWATRGCGAGSLSVVGPWWVGSGSVVPPWWRRGRSSRRRTPAAGRAGCGRLRPDAADCVGYGRPPRAVRVSAYAKRRASRRRSRIPGGCSAAGNAGAAHGNANGGGFTGGPPIPFAGSYSAPAVSGVLNGSARERNWGRRRAAWGADAVGVKRRGRAGARPHHAGGAERRPNAGRTRGKSAVTG